MITLEELAQEVHNLSPLPAAAAKLAQLAADEDVQISSIVDTIRFDQSLSASVLCYANSPIAGSYYRIKGIKEAVIRLGLGKILEIAIGSHVHGQMRRPLPEYGLDEEEMWRHSVAAALAAELLMHQHPNEIPPLSFTAALMHDIGKLILARHLEPKMQSAIQRLTSDYSMTYYQAEHEVLGFTHAGVGARIAERWNLVPEIIKAIAQHHETEDIDDRITDVVCIGNLVAKTIGLGLGFEGLNLAVNPQSCVRIGVQREEFEGLCAEVSSHLQVIEELYA